MRVSSLLRLSPFLHVHMHGDTRHPPVPASMQLVTGAMLSMWSVVSKPSTVTRLPARFFASRKLAFSVDTDENSGGQFFGIPTLGGLFKHVLSYDSNRSSFLKAFVPNVKILSSTRLDDRINPLVDLQHLRNYINRKDTAKTFRKMCADPGSFGVWKPARSALKNGIDAETNINSLQVDESTKKCIVEFANHFDEFKSAFPKLKHNSQLDFVCETDQGEYALVEMQVKPVDYWDRRALAYVAAFYGNQLRRGGQWRDIKKVIGINILGGGTDGEVHWRNTPDQFERHYKLQEQLHKKTCERFIEGIELFQYSLANAPDCSPSMSREKQDWITYFKRASRMTPKDVESQIQTPAVLKAFEMSTLSRLPPKVKAVYDAENAQYAHISEHTAHRFAEGKIEGLLCAARVLKQLRNMSNEEIASRLNLSVDDVANMEMD